MAGWLVTLRGIRYRSGRSLVVFLLAVLATTAAVLAPAYARVAQQSALSDQLSDLPAGTLGLTITGGSDPQSLAAELGPVIGSQHPLGDVVAPAYHGSVATVVLRSLTGTPTSHLVYRSGVCAHLRITAGACPRPDTGDVLVSASTAGRYRLRAGAQIVFGGTDPDPAHAARYRHRVAGIYRLRNAGEPYWWGGGQLAGAPATGTDPRDREEAVLATDPGAGRWLGARGARAELDFPVRPGRIDMDTVPALRAALARLDTTAQADQVTVRTGLTSAFDDARREQRAIGTAVPVVAVPLVLLCWFVLYLMVASLIEERGPEIALAKLRGVRTPAVLRFGLGEAMLLILLAAPVGLALGELVVQLTALLVLRDGSRVELRWPVLAVALFSLAGALVAAVLAARRTVRLPVLRLLRRVPQRSRWRAGIGEGALVALAGAALYQVVSDPSATLGLLAPPLLAFVVGLVAARSLGFVAGRRLRASHGRLPAPRLLSTAQLARRPIAQRIVLAVTVAVSLLAFAATAWDVAGHNRRQVAQDEVGAEHVYTVTASGPQALRDVVRHLDPAGRYLMPAMQSEVHFGDGSESLLAVDPARLAAVADWSGRSADQVRALARGITGTAPAPPTVRGPLRVDVSTEVLDTTKPVQLVALLARPDQPPTEVTLGTLRRAQASYRAELPGCAAGCALTGLGLSRYPGEFHQVDATFRIDGVHDGGRTLAMGLDTAGRWRASAIGADEGSVRLSTGRGLTVRYTGTGADGPVVSYATTPARWPAVIAGPAPADDPHSDRFSFPAFGDEPVAFRRAGAERVIPRAGGHALLVDLTLVQRRTSMQPSGSDHPQAVYQVWAAPGAPTGLAGRLAAAGLSVQRTDSLADTSARLGRQAPALALRLYLIAGVAALLLAVGATLLTAQIGAGGRRYELAALQVVGLSRADQARAIRREYRLLLGVPLVAGLFAGAAGAVLMLPSLSLVSAGDAGVDRVYQLGPYWVPGAVLVTVLALVVATVLVARMLGGSGADRLRAGAG